MSKINYFIIDPEDETIWSFWADSNKPLETVLRDFIIEVDFDASMGKDGKTKLLIVKEADCHTFSCKPGVEIKQINKKGKK